MKQQMHNNLVLKLLKQRIFNILKILVIAISIRAMNGCTANIGDSAEFHYNPIKLDHDTNFSKGELFRIQSDQLEEASGIAASAYSPGHYYVHNDSGNPEEIYLIDSLGALKVKILLKGIKNRDWEDICTGPGPEKGKNYIYLSDIGDNQYIHRKYNIYRFEEPKIPVGKFPKEFIVSDISKFTFSYPDKVSYNAEAFMTDKTTGASYIITKSKYSSVYSLTLPATPLGNIIAQHITDLPIAEVTGADISAKGDILIKDYTRVYLWKNIHSIPTDSLIKTIPVESSYTIEPQGEGICWDLNGKSYVTISEVRHLSGQYLIRYYGK